MKPIVLKFTQKIGMFLFSNIISQWIDDEMYLLIEDLDVRTLNVLFYSYLSLYIIVTNTIIFI